MCDTDSSLLRHGCCTGCSWSQTVLLDVGEFAELQSRRGKVTDMERRKVFTTVLVVAVALPLCIWDYSRNNHETTYIGAACLLHCSRALFAPVVYAVCSLWLCRPRRAVWLVAGIFFLLTVPVSVYGVQARLRGAGGAGHDLP